MNLKLYIDVCRLLEIDLSHGYLFRAASRTGCVSASPFIGSAVESRLVFYLKELSLYEGESTHSFRRGLSLSLAFLGASHSEVASFVGWSSEEMAKHYTQEFKLFRSLQTSSKLMDSLGQKGSPVSSLSTSMFSPNDLSSAFC